MLQTAVILAGGFGTRLQSVINDVPKPMAPVNGEPFLSYQLNYLKHSGIKKVILSVGYLAEKITAFYGASYNGLEIGYVAEHTPLGTGGGIRLALEQSTDEEIFVLNGDSFFDVDLKKFHDLHSTGNAQFSLALRNVSNAARYGTVETDAKNKIVSFREKTGQEQDGKINGGAYILNRPLYLSSTPEAGNFSIEKDFFEKQLNTYIIKGFEFDGYFIDIGIPEDYTKVQDDFKGFAYR